MPDQPQWPFIPAIEGHVPLPKPDPRSANAKSLAFAQALMGNHTPAVPMPRPDPRDWATRAVMPQVGDENTSLGAIHPDALMQSRSGGAFTPPPTIDDNTYNQRAIDIINHNAAHGKQAPIGIPQQGWQQDVSNGLFGVPAHHLQQMAGDVVPFPMPLGFGGSPSQEKYKSQKLQGDVPAKPFDPMGDMTGGGKVLPGPGYTSSLPMAQHLAMTQSPQQTKSVDQNLPKIPQTGFVPSLSPMYMNDKGLGAPPAPGMPPIFWQPG